MDDTIENKKLKIDLEKKEKILNFCLFKKMDRMFNNSGSNICSTLSIMNTKYIRYFVALPL